ncbi:AAEL005756-PB [Aedes aegypti]|uniref:AAEL005756-PB n=1 Tax=Aedes aegypti TaxID=7159 RepID=Q178W7_AEDAE|nr:AAEL005756-PB [Aedes aegypti]
MARSLLILITALLIAGPLACLADGDPCLLNPFIKTCIEAKLRATYDEIVDLKYKFDTLLIDVRTPEEVACTGSIPTSINIPLDKVADELKLAPHVFLCKYGRKKPILKDLVIFYCHSGNRSATAAHVAVQLGFIKVKSYVGSWIEYATHHCLPLDCTGAIPDSCGTLSSTITSETTTTDPPTTSTTEPPTTAKPSTAACPLRRQPPRRGRPKFVPCKFIRVCNHF